MAAIDNTICGICLGDISSQQSPSEDQLTTALKCSHIFHESCIGEWLAKQKTCPLCRFSLEENPSPSSPSPSPSNSSRRPTFGEYKELLLSMLVGNSDDLLLQETNSNPFRTAYWRIRDITSQLTRAPHRRRI